MKEGAALVRQFGDLMLRTYNIEADNCVRTVRAHTVDTAKKRLEQTREAIVKNGSTMGVAIDESFHALRLEELQLTADHHLRVEQEKEDAREERQRQREEAKAQEEFKRRKKDLLKEQAHYQSLLDRSRANGDEAGLLEARERLAEITESIEEVEEMAANTRVGYVYVISNVGAFGDRVVKIGMTRREDPMQRVYELGSASVPFKFDVHALVFSHDAVALETALHREFDQQRVNRVNRRREFFRVSLAEVRAALEKVGTNHVVEFRELAEAPEWRQSQAQQPARRPSRRRPEPVGGTEPWPVDAESSPRSCRSSGRPNESGSGGPEPPPRPSATPSARPLHDARARCRTRKLRDRLYAEDRTREAAEDTAQVEQQVEVLQSVLAATLGVDDHLDLEALKQAPPSPLFDPLDGRSAASASARGGTSRWRARRRSGGCSPRRSTPPGPSSVRPSTRRPWTNTRSRRSEHMRSVWRRRAAGTTRALPAGGGAPAARRGGQRAATRSGGASAGRRRPLPGPGAGGRRVPRRLPSLVEPGLRRERPGTSPSTTSCRQWTWCPPTRPTSTSRAPTPSPRLPRPAAQIRSLYTEVLRQTALRVVHEVLEADGQARSGRSSSTATSAAPTRPPAARSAPASWPSRRRRERFLDVDLARVDTVACLAHLEARVSKDPSKLQAVEPIVLSGSLEADYTLDTDSHADEERASTPEMEPPTSEVMSRSGTDEQLLQPGQNVPLSATQVQVDLQGRQLDLSVLLVGPNGRVERDEDFIFYNNPRSASGAVILTENNISIDTALLPRQQERVVVVVSTSEAPSVGTVTAVLRNPGGGVVRFETVDSTQVAALVWGEFYLRNGAWRFRAVGQGWADGLAGLARDYGVNVD